MLLALLATCQTYAQTYVPESPRSQKAVYDAEKNTVTISAVAPSQTEFDWYTYEQYDLPYISYIKIERHGYGTEWPEDEYARVENPEVGKTFEFVDTNVEADKKYEYKLTCYVDDNNSSSVYVSVYTGVIPGELLAFTATTASHLADVVDLSVTAPTQTSTGAELKSACSIEIQQYEDWTYTTIHTIENAEPGKTYTWQHSGIATGHSYHYRALARMGTEGKGQASEADTYVGLDYPGTPQNFAAEPQGESVRLTWDAPLKGGRGGCYDPESTTYTLRRVYQDKTEEVAAEGIKGMEYTDTPNFAEETAVAYKLVAVNASGESTREATLDAVMVGKPATLPFKESFADGGLEHKGWTTETTQDDEYYTYKAWEYTANSSMYYYPNDDYLTLEPQDNDGGFASCRFYGYSEDGQTESLVSPRISVEGIDRVNVCLYLWALQEEASKNVLCVKVSRDNGEWETAYTSEPLTMGMPAWSKLDIPVSLGKTVSTIRVRIEAVRHSGPIVNVFVDNINVTEDSSATAINGVAEGDDDAAEEVFTLSGVRVGSASAPGTYIVRKGSVTKKIVVR